MAKSRPIKEPEYHKLFKQALLSPRSAKKWTRAITLLHVSALRVSEMLDIRTSDIIKAVESGVLRVYISKQDKMRDIPLSVLSVNKLKNSLDDEYEEYYLSNAQGAALNSKGFTAEINKFIKATLGVGYSSHGFRIGTIEAMVENKVDPRTVQEFIGHANVSTTLGYYDPSENTIRKALVW